MKMDRLYDLEAFLAIVDKGSQTAAARHLDRSLQSVGRSLAALEHSLGVELVRRSTRRSNPTDAGVRFYSRLKPAFLEINAAKRELQSKRAEPSGRLRVSAPVLFASAFVAPAICDLVQRYPQLDVELKATDRKVDLYEEGFDVAVRIRQLPDSELKARRIGTLRVVVFGAPAYFAKHGRPKRPEDLERLECVLRSAEPGGDRWPFRVRGRRVMVRVGGRFRTDDAAATRVAVAGGIGIGMAPFWQVQLLLDRAEVEIILEEFETPGLPIVAVSPPSKQPATNVRLLVDLLAARLKRVPGL
jgi:DNA-binding transcriptional LysR family regulator